MKLKLIYIPKVQLCDARDDTQRGVAGNKNLFSNFC